MKPSPDYWALIEAEEKAEERLRELADQLAEGCRCLWHYGDGNGGHVLSIIRDAFYKRVGYPTESVPGRSRHIPGRTKKAVFERDAYRCVKCASYKNLCIDHVYPWSLGGSNEPDNLQTLCWDCNSKKSNKVEAPHE